MPGNNDEGFVGQLRAEQASNGYDALIFTIQQILNRVQTATLVKVLTCTNKGELAPVGRVDVQPLVNQLDGALNAVPHATIFDVPYFRLQGGTDAVILDPKPGDIGIAVFASRDISAVKSSKQQSNPGSGRTHDMADALYIGGVLNGKPEQFVRFSADGIEVLSPKKIRLAAPQVVIDASASMTINTPSFDLNRA